MARRDTSLKIEFDSPATVGEMIEALEDLRSRVGDKALVRIVGSLTGWSAAGSLITAVLVDKPNT